MSDVISVSDALPKSRQMMLVPLPLSSSAATPCSYRTQLKGTAVESATARLCRQHSENAQEYVQITVKVILCINIAGCVRGINTTGAHSVMKAEVMLSLHALSWETC